MAFNSTLPFCVTRRTNYNISKDVKKNHLAIKNAQHVHLKVVILSRVSFTKFPNNATRISFGGVHVN